MSSESDFNKEIVSLLSKNIPCMHIPTSVIAERVLRVFYKYLEELRDNGASSIDHVLAEMKVKNEW